MKTLYVFKQAGCSACAQAEKTLQAWQRDKWGKVGIIRLDIAVKDWTIAGYSPKATPAYLLVDERNSPVNDYEGAMSAEELDEFISDGMEDNEDENQGEAS